MTDLRLRVSADVSAYQSELQKVQAATQKINDTLSSGQVGIDTREAKAELAALEASTKALADLLEKASKSGEELVGVDFGSVSSALEDAAQAATQLDQVLEAVGQSSGMSATVRNTKAVAENLQRATRAQEALGREGIKVSRQQAEAAKQQFDRWRQSGARGTTRIRNQEFDDWISGGWRNHSMDEAEARRHRDRVLGSVGIEAPGGAAGSGGGGRSGIAQAVISGMGRRAGPAAAAVGGVVGSMMSGGDGGIWGGMGNAAGSGLGGLAGFLVGGPMGAMIGSAFGGAALGGLGRAIDGGIGRSTEEGGILTDLRRSVGATKVDFEELRQSVRYFTDGLGLTYNESAKLASSFAHIANLQDAQSLGKEVRDSAGFGRGYGMSPEAAVNFFATMRHFGATSGLQDQRRLALQIGEAVNRGGTSAKMDEVLSALQQFTQHSTRASLTQANAEAYLSFMSSLTGLGLHGMKGDPESAASAMNQADQALRMGGAFGAASKNFSLGLYQRMLPGFNALDMDFVNEQGAFGSIGGAFGRDSAAYKLAESRGDRKKMDRYDQWVRKGGDRTMLSMQMQALDRQFGGNTDEFRKAIQSHLGVSASQASALYQAYQNDVGLGGLQAALGRAGIDTSKLNAKQIASMAELATANDSGIRQQGTKLLGLTGSDALNKTETGELKKLMAGNDPEALRKMVLNLTALHDTTKDQGELLRKQQADMSNAIQKLVTELIPLTMTIKDGIVELVKWFTPDSEFVKNEEKKKAEIAAEQAKAKTLDQDIASAKRNVDNYKAASPEQLSQNDAAIAALKKQRDAAAARGDKKAVAAYDHNIKLLEDANRAGSPQGKQDLIDKHNALVAERNSLRNIDPSNAAPLDGTGRGTAAPRKARTGMKLTPDELSFLAETDRLLGAKPGTSAAQIQVESGNDPNAVSPKGAWGLAQLMPDTKAKLERRLGRKIESRKDQLLAHRMVMQENLQKFGNLKDAQRAYNGGWDRSKWNNAETSAYPDRIEAERIPQDSSLDRKAPSGINPGVGPAASNRHDIRIDNVVTLLDQQGNERGGSVVQTRIGAPVPTGMFA